MENYISVVLPIICSGVSTIGVWLIQERYKRKDGHREALRVLMRKELRDIHDAASAAHGVTEDQMTDFNEIYEAYHKLGGNGRATIWKHDLETMERIG